MVHDKLVAFAEAMFGTSDIRSYAAELWAKYSGADGYEQEHHRDYSTTRPWSPPRTCAACRAVAAGQSALLRTAAVSA